MKTLFRSLKKSFEQISGYRMYKNGCTHGYDCYLDIHKSLGQSGVKVVFDVGANVGQSTITYLEQFPQAQIYSFEPVVGTYRKLVETTKQHKRVHPYNLGMGREPGETTINVNPVSLVSSIVLRRDEDHPETIKLESIPSFAHKNQIESIDFLKIDTEGYELEVLAGATPLLQAQKIHFVLCECKPVISDHNFIRFSDLTDFMSKFGYKLFGVYDQTLDCDGKHSLIYWNALFICEKLIPKDAKF
jgi:FkbM family methyltransferase